MPWQLWPSSQEKSFCPGHHQIIPTDTSSLRWKTRSLLPAHSNLGNSSTFSPFAIPVSQSIASRGRQNSSRTVSDQRHIAVGEGRSAQITSSRSRDRSDSLSLPKPQVRERASSRSCASHAGEQCLAYRQHYKDSAFHRKLKGWPDSCLCMSRGWNRSSCNLL